MSEEDINDQNTIESVVDHHPDEISQRDKKIVEDIIETLRENQKKDINLGNNKKVSTKSKALNTIKSPGLKNMLDSL